MARMWSLSTMTAPGPDAFQNPAFSQDDLLHVRRLTDHVDDIALGCHVPGVSNQAAPWRQRSSVFSFVLVMHRPQFIALLQDNAGIRGSSMRMTTGTILSRFSPLLTSFRIFMILPIQKNKHCPPSVRILLIGLDSLYHTSFSW